MAGRDVKIGNLNALPQLGEVLEQWGVAFRADYVYQVMVDGEPQNRSRIVTISGVVQPLRVEEVNLKPEGQRAWSWYQLHVAKKYDLLRIQQIVQIGGIPYKIMAKKNYDSFGYCEYHIVRDYDEAA